MQSVNLSTNVVINSREPLEGASSPFSKQDFDKYFPEWEFELTILVKSLDHILKEDKKKLPSFLNLFSQYAPCDRAYLWRYCIGVENDLLKLELNPDELALLASSKAPSNNHSLISELDLMLGGWSFAKNDYSEAWKSYFLEHSIQLGVGILLLRKVPALNNLFKFLDDAAFINMLTSPITQQNIKVSCPEIKIHRAIRYYPQILCPIDAREIEVLSGENLLQLAFREQNCEVLTAILNELDSRPSIDRKFLPLNIEQVQNLLPFTDREHLLNCFHWVCREKINKESRYEELKKFALDLLKVNREISDIYKQYFAYAWGYKSLWLKEKEGDKGLVARVSLKHKEGAHKLRPLIIKYLTLITENEKKFPNLPELNIKQLYDSYFTPRKKNPVKWEQKLKLKDGASNKYSVFTAFNRKDFPRDTFLLNEGDSKLVVPLTPYLELEKQLSVPKPILNHLNKWCFSPVCSTESYNIFAQVLPGNCFEISSFDEESTKNDDFWDHWQFHDLLGGAGAEYQDIIHPILTRYASTILKNIENPQIVEICAGTGSLARKILKDLNKPLRYLLLERNEKSRRDASITLKEYDATVQIVPTDIVADKVWYSDAKRSQPIQESSQDLVIGSGALTHNVLSKDGAQCALAKIVRILKADGYLLLMGLTASLLSARDFEAFGFKVINTNFPGFNKNLYVLQKIRDRTFLPSE